MKVIEIVIDPSGESRIATHGFSGSECREASRFLETALGQRTAETLTAEFHQKSVEQSNHLQQGRE